MEIMQQVVIIAALALLQSAGAQDGAQDTEENSSNGGSNQPTLLNVDQYLLQLNSKLDTLAMNLETIKSKLESLDSHFWEHKQNTSAELPQLQTSITTTQSSLSTHVQQVNSKFSNLTHQLEALQYSLQNIAVHSCGWRRVAYMDFTDPNIACPSGWQLTGYSKRTCGRASQGTSICDSAFFSVNGGEYRKVCGRIKAYQWGSPDAFARIPFQQRLTVDSGYVDGVSVTHGNPRRHIWTFAAGASEPALFCPSCSCPCDTHRAVPPPAFVGNDYFCESGQHEQRFSTTLFFSNDPLWDGQNCLSSSTCCSLHDPPYFVKVLPFLTTDDIEARICLDQGSGDENIAVELVELYVQ